MSTCTFFRFLMFCVLIQLIGLLPGCGGNGEEKNEAATAITTMIIRPSKERATVIVSGKLSAWQSAHLSFKIGGRIATITTDVGDSVKMGQEMASLDQDEIKAKAVQAELAYGKAKRDFDRAKALYEENAATKEQIENAATALGNAVQVRTVALYNLEYSRIEAPFNGTVATKRHDPGEMIQPGDPVFVFVGASGRFKVKCWISESYVERVVKNAEARVSFAGKSKQQFVGHVTRLGAAADPRTGLFPLEIEIVDSTGVLRPGLVAAVTLSMDGTEESLLVPPQALVEADEDRGYIFVFNQDASIVKKTPVKLGEIIGDKVAVLSGLASGAEIVVEGASFVIDGQVVSKQSTGTVKNSMKNHENGGKG